MTPVVRFDGVVKRYGAAAVVDHLSFNIMPGEMFGLIGPDGAGKTTAIRLLCGLLHVDAGRICVFGDDPVTSHRALTARVGYLSQRFSLYGDLTVDENVAFFAEIHGVNDYRDRRERLLQMMQLTPFRSRLADRLSGGMKQKLALACTLVHEPSLIVLDEPTTGVDPVSRREFWKLLSYFLSTGITIVMSTPYLDEAERCSRVALLDRGRLMALDTPKQLRADLTGTLLEVSTPDVRSAHRVLTAEGWRVQLFGDRLHVWIDQEESAAIDAFMADAGPLVAADRVRSIPASLEDVYIAHLRPEAATAVRGEGFAEGLPS